MEKNTQRRCIVAIAEIHPYTIREISNVFERCGSIDKTIDVVHKARETNKPLLDVCELMGV